MTSNCQKCNTLFNHRTKNKMYCSKCAPSIGGPCTKCNKKESYRWYNKKTTCSNCYLIQYNKDNPEKAKQYAQTRYQNYKPKMKDLHKTSKKKQYMKEYWKNNKDKKKIYDQTYYEKHKNVLMVKQKEYRKEYSQRPEVKRMMNFHCVKRQNRTNLATPKWADLKQIKEIYLNCPKGYEVDHIIPIKNEIVSGLHVENNLQYLTRYENRSKSNKFNLDGSDDNDSR